MFFDTLLSELAAAQTIHIAYADDLLVIVTEDSPQDIERAAQQAQSTSWQIGFPATDFSYHLQKQ